MPTQTVLELVDTLAAGRPLPGANPQAAVVRALVDEVALCGPRERIRERFEAWKSSGVTTMICGAGQTEALRLMAELAL